METVRSSGDGNNNINVGMGRQDVEHLKKAIDHARIITRQKAQVIICLAGLVLIIPVLLMSVYTSTIMGRLEKEVATMSELTSLHIANTGDRIVMMNDKFEERSRTNMETLQNCLKRGRNGILP